MAQEENQKDAKSQGVDRVSWQVKCTNGSIRCIITAVILGIALLLLLLPLSFFGDKIFKTNHLQTIIAFAAAAVVAVIHLTYVTSGCLALIAILGHVISLFRVKGFWSAVSTLALAFFLFGLNLFFWSPALAGARQHFDDIQCRSHMKTLASALDDHTNATGRRPDSSKWCDVIRAYVADAEDFTCPFDRIGPCSYAMNKNLPESLKDVPSDMVVLFESDPGWNQVGGPEAALTDQPPWPGCNVLFGNGQVEFVKAADIAKLRWRTD
jgi:hypothetical protein